MPSAAWALQQSIFAALAGDAALTGLLGANHIYDDVPQGTRLPYITVGPATSRDWSTSTDDGTEHTLVLHVWSSARGKKETQEIIAGVRSVLHDQPLALTGHRLINLRHEASDIRRNREGETLHGIVRFRAVTEPS